MNNSEIRELRKRIDVGLSNFRSIYGCYVNAAKEIVSTMEIPVLDMSMEERELYSNLLRKTISGPPGRHLIDVSFDTSQVEDSDEHRMLMSVRDSLAKDDAARTLLYERIVESFDNDGKSYVILLAAETYDLPSKDFDEEWSEESTDQFTYFICSICKVKDAKAALRYRSEPKAFRGASTGSLLSDPMVGFIFPAFSGRKSDIYTVPYYTRDVSNIHEEFIEGLFRVSDVPSASSTKKELFGQALAESLGDDCSLDVMTAIQGKLSARLEADGEGDQDSSRVMLSDIEDILREKGVDQEKAEDFRTSAEELLGADDISIHSLVEKNSYRITSSDADIRVDPGQAVRLRTAVIGGVTYILVPAGSDVRVNGLDVSLAGAEEI